MELPINSIKIKRLPVSDKDRKAFALNAFVGVMYTLTLVATHYDQFTTGSEMFDNPQQVMQDIKQIVKNLAGVRELLTQQLDPPSFTTANLHCELGRIHVAGQMDSAAP